MVEGPNRDEAQKLVIFDLCDTLYDVNTTVGFIEHFQSRNQAGRIARAVRRWSSKASPFFYVGATAHRLLGRDIARQRMIASLAGETRVNLAEAARDYARHVLPLHANKPLHERLNMHLTAGDRVILLSNSLDLVVDEVAEALGVEGHASKLGFEGDRCTGRLELDLTGRKAAAIQQLIDNYPSIRVYTDNRSDRDLIEVADEATIVIPRGKPDRHWAGSDCEYVRL